MQTRLHRIPYRLGALTTVLIAAITISACTAFDRIADPVVEIEGGDPRLGRQAIRDFGCMSCHSVPGVTGADAWVGPPLDNWANREYIAGRVPNDPETLILFLLDPKTVDPETAMPVTGLTEEDARNIASYLYTLSDD